MISVTSLDWLDMGSYAATYYAGSKEASGRFAVVDCKISDGKLVFSGAFRRAATT